MGDFYSQTIGDHPPLYDSDMFRANFKLPLGLFDEIVAAVFLRDYFVQRPDATGLPGATPLQKIAAGVRMLTSGVSAQELEDKYRLGSSTMLESLKNFCAAVIDIYGASALRGPTEVDLNRLLDEGVEAGFPGCIGSIDCMHWAWKNCPSAWKAMFQGKAKVATVVLEAIADHRGRFWHFNFGTPGALNDINFLDRSPLFHNAVNGVVPEVLWKLKGREYRFPYWLADGIYPAYACFLKTIQNPSTRMQKYFSSRQEAKRKDIERAFGVLQSRFHILTTRCRLWDREAMTTVIKTCVILHNLNIDYERRLGLDPTYITTAMYAPTHPFTLIPRGPRQDSTDRTLLIRAMKNHEAHSRMQRDLMDEMWEMWSLANEAIET